jgi:hypothetical protein
LIETGLFVLSRPVPTSSFGKDSILWTVTGIHGIEVLEEYVLAGMSDDEERINITKLLETPGSSVHGILPKSRTIGAPQPALRTTGDRLAYLHIYALPLKFVSCFSPPRVPGLYMISASKI